MKRLNNTFIIGIDHGYGNIKTASTITPAAITSSPTAPVFTGCILEYDGIFYRIGEGHKEFIPDKSQDDDYYILTLMAIARELSLRGIHEANIHIAAGLPITWVGRQRDSFRAYLLREPEVSYRYNGQDYHIHFAGCSIYPQSYPAIIQKLDELTGTSLLADIGCGTMNILYFEDKRPQESRSWTEKLGVNQCVIAAQNAVLDHFGAKVDPEIIERIIRTGTAAIGEDYLDCITETCRSYCRDIFDALRRYEYHPDLMHLYVVGGGGILLKHFGEIDEKNITIINDLCAAARGYERLIYERLSREVNA